MGGEEQELMGKGGKTSARICKSNAWNGRGNAERLSPNRK